MKIEGNQKEGNEGNVFRRYSGIPPLFRGVPAFRCSMFRRCSAVPRVFRVSVFLVLPLFRAIDCRAFSSYT